MGWTYADVADAPCELIDAGLDMLQAAAREHERGSEESRWR